MPAVSLRFHIQPLRYFCVITEL